MGLKGKEFRIGITHSTQRYRKMRYADCFLVQADGFLCLRFLIWM